MCAASESPIPLVKLETAVPDIVPDMISLFILRCTVPELGKFVDDASVKLVDEVVNAPLNVVDINEDAPVIVTLLLVLYIP